MWLLTVRFRRDQDVDPDLETGRLVDDLVASGLEEPVLSRLRCRSDAAWSRPASSASRTVASAPSVRAIASPKRSRRPIRGNRRSGPKRTGERALPSAQRSFVEFAAERAGGHVHVWSREDRERSNESVAAGWGGEPIGPLLNSHVGCRASNSACRRRSCGGSGPAPHVDRAAEDEGAVREDGCRRLPCASPHVSVLAR